jgi:hypothetical protein
MLADEHRPPNPHLRLQCNRVHPPLLSECSAMTAHSAYRSWLRLGMWWCTCGRRAWHPMPPQTPDGRLADGDAVPFTGYRRTVDVLAKPQNRGCW